MPETQEMTAAAFTEAMATLGLADAADAGAAMDSDERTVRRWRTGERGVPGPVATLVRLWIRIQATRSLNAAQRAMLLPPGAAVKPVTAQPA